MPTSRRINGVVLTEHELEVPLDHADPAGRKITVFARVVEADDDGDRPYLCFFQGGPGSEAPRPDTPVSGFVERALKDYKLVLLDQRGTGRSTPVGSLPGMSPQEQAEYLAHHRADAIVRDAEAFRQHFGAERWSIVGQSFGGFCVTNYLSQAPEGLLEAFITAGLPPLGRPTEEVYAATYGILRDRIEQYYARYPEDRDRVRRIVEYVESNDVRLPSGDRLTMRRFRHLGDVLGMSYGAEHLHYAVERPLGSPGFLDAANDPAGFIRNPLYAIVHEACYADGCVTAWAADRVMPDDFRNDPTLFWGEMLHPWVFDDYGALEPLKEAAELLAQREWPALYDADVLAANDVRCAAAIWVHDMYVPRTFSEETALRIKGMRAWITSEYEHDGLRKDGARVLGRLIDLANGRD
ncbi:MAG TPA: alpha/beta fold hydrolase [Gaiellaceae bacterium]|nr:alpha/beta fold hydrolase [Gaiellaceae bacterium]